MGQTLSEPVTAKESATCENKELLVGSSSMQGWRVHMEDAHTHLLSLPDDPDAAFFGVYDGHGGAKIAQYVGRHLHKHVVNSPEYAEGRIEDALRQAFLKIDEAMMVDEELQNELSGTTAVTALLKDKTLYVANVGDSRVIASVNGLVDALSLDHKPANEKERERIQAAGGWVEFNRVNGNLALSRALGDFIFKKNAHKEPDEQIVSPFPDIEVRKVTEDWEFMLMACDGIWDVMTNEEVGAFVRSRIANGMKPADICEELMTHCLAPDSQTGGLGCDNMTVVLVAFLNGRPYSELSAKCAVPPPEIETAVSEAGTSRAALSGRPYSEPSVQSSAAFPDDTTSALEPDPSSE